jgi:steroid delta-isomerase-like uncharacterized protein
MARDDSEKLIRAYYAAFNAKDETGFLALLAEDVVHDINQGGCEHGKKAFAAFLTRMNLCYDEEIVDLMVMANEDGSRAAAEFTVLGTYIAGDSGLPPAHGQKYRLPAGAFFDIKNNKVVRISNYYNLEDWLKQVGG